MVAIETKRIPIMFDKQLVERIDDYSYENRIRTRSEAIRRLVLTSLETSANKKGEPSA